MSKRRRREPDPALSERSADAGARLLERALALPLPLPERLVEGEHDLEDRGDLALGWLASFERTYADASDARRAAAERGQAWLDWLAERWARRWGPSAARTPEAWKMFQSPPQRREPTNVAQICWNHSLVSFAAWSRGARWFGAGLLEADEDTAIFLMAFVGRIGDEDAPPGPASGRE